MVVPCKARQIDNSSILDFEAGSDGLLTCETVLGVVSRAKFSKQQRWLFAMKVVKPQGSAQ